MAQSPPGLTVRPEGRAEELERMRLRVAELRAGIGRDVHELRSRVRDGLDLRRQLARHPVAAALAVLAGSYLAVRVVQGLLRRARTPRATAARRRRDTNRRAVPHARSGEPALRPARPKEGIE